MWNSIVKTKNRLSISSVTVIVIIIAIIVRFWKLWSVPAGYNVDEMGSAFDAWSLLHSGVDRWGIRFPVYFWNYGSGQSALIVYMMMLSEAVFGFTTFAIRFPSFIGSVLVLLAGVGVIEHTWENFYGISKDILKLLFAILYLISPLCQMMSHLGLDCDLMFGFSILFLYTLILAVDKEDWKYYVLSGICCGVMLYTYAISYLVTIIFLVFAIIYLIITKRVNIKEVAAFVIPLCILAFPLILVQYINITGHESVSLGIFTAPKLAEYRAGEFTFSNLADNFFLTIKSALFYDFLDYNTMPRYFTFYPMSVPFAFIGCVVCIGKTGTFIEKKQYNGLSLVTFWFISMFFISCLLGGNGESGINPNTNKINGIFFPTMIFIVVGIVYCFKNITIYHWKKILAFLLSVVYFAFTIKFYHNYYHYYVPENYWNYTYSDAVDFLKEKNLDNKTIISDEAYTYYLASVRPLQSDFVVSGDNIISKDNTTIDYINSGFSDDVLAQYPDANYIYPVNSEYNFTALENAGYKLKEFKYCYLFYKD